MLEILKLRSRIVKRIRNVFESLNYMEVETPILTPYRNPDSNVKNVKATFSDFKGREFNWFLHTSPEFFMKRLIWHGAERIFQITKVFRDGEITDLHNVEFTMVEWYRVGSDYRTGMEETLEIIRSCADELGVRRIEVDETTISLEETEYITVEEAFLEFAGVSPFDEEKLKYLTGENCYETAFFKILVDRVEPSLSRIPRPVILYNYPSNFGAFSKRRGNIAERFEVYIGGIELANGYTEMTDHSEYSREMEKHRENQDIEFLKLLKKKPLPNCEGVALGLDRLAMILLGKKKISHIIPFSTERLIKESSL